MFPLVFGSEHCYSLYQLWFFSFLLKMVKIRPMMLPSVIYTGAKRSLHTPFLFIVFWLRNYESHCLFALVSHENLYLVVSSLWCSKLFRICFYKNVKKEHKVQKMAKMEGTGRTQTQKCKAGLSRRSEPTLIACLAQQKTAILKFTFLSIGKSTKQMFSKVDPFF